MEGDLLEFIQSRRTIKYFLPKFVSWEKISRVIDAGRHAPSSGNIQNWKFIVVFDPSQKQELAKVCYEQYEIAQAGALIVVCNEIEKVERYYGVRGERLYGIQNCAAAIQNMLLEAHSLGLGSRWIGGFDEDALKSMLGIPEDVRPQAVVAVGYAKEVPPKPPKYPLESIVYLRKWRNKLRDPDRYMNNVAAILSRKAKSIVDEVKESVDSVVDKTKEATSKILPKKDNSEN